MQAGDIVTITLKSSQASLRVKIEDSSKGDVIGAKVESSGSSEYNAGQVYEFNRQDIEIAA